MTITPDINMADIICVLPALVVFFASLVPLTIKVFKNNREPNTLSSVVYALIGLIGAGIMSVLLHSSKTPGNYYFGNALVLDGLSTLSTLLKDDKSTILSQFFKITFVHLLSNDISLNSQLCKTPVITLVPPSSTD